MSNQYDHVYQLATDDFVIHRVRSQVDGMNLEGLHSTRIFSTPDFSNDRYLIRWIEIFLLQMNEDSPRLLFIYLSLLVEHELTSLSL